MQLTLQLRNARMLAIISVVVGRLGIAFIVTEVESRKGR